MRLIWYWEASFLVLHWYYHIFALRGREEGGRTNSHHRAISLDRNVDCIAMLESGWRRPWSWFGDRALGHLPSVLNCMRIVWQEGMYLRKGKEGQGWMGGGCIIVALGDSEIVRQEKERLKSVSSEAKFFSACCLKAELRCSSSHCWDGAVMDISLIFWRRSSWKQCHRQIAASLRQHFYSNTSKRTQNSIFGSRVFEVRTIRTGIIFYLMVLSKMAFLLRSSISANEATLNVQIVHQSASTCQLIAEMSQFWHATLYHLIRFRIWQYCKSKKSLQANLDCDIRSRFWWVPQPIGSSKSRICVVSRSL